MEYGAVRATTNYSPMSRIPLADRESLLSFYLLIDFIKKTKRALRVNNIKVIKE